MANNRIRAVMPRLGFVVALLSFGSWSAALGHAQRVATSDAEHATQRITVDADNTPLTTVLYTIARQAGLMPFFDRGLIPSATRVTLHLHEVAAAEAFERALRGTGLVANVHAGGDVTIVRHNPAVAVAGSIMGRVITTAAKQPLAGVKIGLDGTERATETQEDGSYRLTNVSAGSHTVTIKLLGYAKVTRTVAVQDNAATTVDVSLDISATALEQVVVTGTIIPTELKAVPNAMTVITAQEIERRGITKINQLFRGDVPGLFAQNQGSNALLDEVTMFSRGATSLTDSFQGTGPLTGTFTAYSNPIKTYVDGVELVDARYLSQIDPKSIDRIEIITGPQASTIYGSNAINGVMQIFTKRGTVTRPQLTLNLLSGWVENNFSSARTPQHDYSAQLNGASGQVSYNGGAAWNYTGPWTPAKQTTQISGFGGVRLETPTSVGRVITDVTFRRSLTQNRQRGSVYQTETGDQERGLYRLSRGTGLSEPTTYVLQGQTAGLALTYTPTRWWSHELKLGQDISNMEQQVTAPGFFFTGFAGLRGDDTTLTFNQTNEDRQSFGYTTTLQLVLTSMVRATLTSGADTWHGLTSLVSLNPSTLTGILSGGYTYSRILRQPDHNTGWFLQTQLSIVDQLFLTYGLRAEWNPGYGAEAQPNYAPRYGLAYVRDIGGITAKARASYGRTTRPPLRGERIGRTAVDDGDSMIWITSYGNFFWDLPNPELGPEYQQGGEGGLELYMGTRGSLIVTRYNQTVDALIADVSPVDSARSLIPNPEVGNIGADGYGYIEQGQYLNVGGIRNQGWELQGTANLGPLTTHATYSWTKSRVIGVTPKYRSLFTASSYPQYQPGATFRYLPEHTWAMGIAYVGPGNTVELNLTGVGQVKALSNDFFAKHINSSIRLPQNRLYMDDFRYFQLSPNFNRDYTLADVMTAHRFSSHMDGTLQIQNLMNQYINDNSAFYATVGRQTKVGLRIRMQ